MLLEIAVKTAHTLETSMSRLWKQVLPRISKVDKPDKRKQTLQSLALRMWAIIYNSDRLTILNHEHRLVTTFTPSEFHVV